MQDVFLALSRNCGVILTNCFLSINICLGLVIRTYWFSVPTEPLLPLQLCHLLLEWIALVSEVVSAFSLLFSSSSSPLPSHHVCHFSDCNRCPCLLPTGYTWGMVTRPCIIYHLCLTLSMPFPRALLSFLGLPTGSLFLGLVDPSHTFISLQQIFPASCSLPWISRADFFLPFSHQNSIIIGIM